MCIHRERHIKQTNNCQKLKKKTQTVLAFYLLLNAYMEKSNSCDLKASNEEEETKFITLKASYINSFCGLTVRILQICFSFFLLHLFFLRKCH